MTPSSTRIRVAAATDLDALAAIAATDAHGSWTRLGLETELKVAGAHVEVVETGSHELVGFMVWRETAGEVELLEIVTHATYRRQGLARALMQHLLETARGQGAPRIMLEVRRDNEAARRLYESLGFVVVGERPRYYADREDAILMDCRLPPA